MSESLLYKGQFLEVSRWIKDNPSIRGIPNPHIEALSKLLFNDYDLDSLIELRRFALNANSDKIKFYYALSVIFLEEKYSFLNQSDFNKIVIFQDNDYKLAIKTIKSFLKNPNIKYINKIHSLGLNDDFKLFILDLCFKYSDLSIDNSFTLYPELKDVFSFSDSIMTISPKDLNFLIENRSILVQSFIQNNYRFFSYQDLYWVLERLISNNTYSSFLLYMFLNSSFESNDYINRYNLIANDFGFYTNTTLVSFLHFDIINNYINNLNDANKQIFNTMIEQGALVVNKDALEWDLDDKDMNDSVNLNMYKNARLYLNSLFYLNDFFLANKNLYNNTNPNVDTLSVYGGLHALSWANLSSNLYNININFSYTFCYDFNAKLPTVDNSLINNLLTDINKKIIVFDIFDFLHLLKNEKVYNANDNPLIHNQLDSLFSDIKNNNIQDIFFTTIPFPSSSTYASSPCKNISEMIFAINNHLTHLANEYNYKLLNINDYINVSNMFIDKKNLINDYLIKPNIINNMLNDFYNDFKASS